jgi:glycosyltransferase involved in cell wall biosynthesis
MKRHVLYITFDGLLEPLGESQVVRLVERLSKIDIARFTVVSLEKEADLQDVARVDALHARLEQSNIVWRYAKYRHGVRGNADNMTRVTEIVGDVVRRDRPSLIHARSYQAGLIAMGMRGVSKVPYLFDFRGYWVDERIEANRWFKNEPSLHAARVLERQLFQNAAGVVSLALPAAGDTLDGKFGAWDDRPVRVIPTAVDETEFSLDLRAEKRLPELEGKLVIGFIGSFNSSYMIDRSFELVADLCDLREDAYLLVLTRQKEEAMAMIQKVGIPEGRYSVESATHAEMPKWMASVDWGLTLLYTTQAKRGSMPTKLGEFLASGVRPIHHGCNDEVTRWVDFTGSGMVVSDLSREGVREVARKIADDESSKVNLGHAREVAMRHFSLARCAQRYADLYDELI